MFDNDNYIGCYTVCHHCQSWPDRYTCSHPDMYVRDLSGKPIQARECFYAYLTEWDKRWLAHPCPLFTGRISIEHDDGSNIEFIIHKVGELVRQPDNLSIDFS